LIFSPGRINIIGEYRL